MIHSCLLWSFVGSQQVGSVPTWFQNADEEDEGEVPGTRAGVSAAVVAPRNEDCVLSTRYKLPHCLQILLLELFFGGLVFRLEFDRICGSSFSFPSSQELFYFGQSRHGPIRRTFLSCFSRECWCSYKVSSCSIISTLSQKR